MTYASKQCPTTAALGSTWQVLLKGAWLQKAQTAVDEIADGLALVPSQLPATTAAELALFYGYLALVKHDAQVAERALHYLNAAIDQVGSQQLSTGFIGGYPQVGWVITQLAGKVFDRHEAEICLAVDDALLTHLRSLAQPTDFDLISGLTGIGVYALSRMPEPSAIACLQAVVERLAERAERNKDGAAWFTPPAFIPEWQQKICPKGYYNLGLAHGVPGVIAFLARACTAESVRAAAHPLLEDAVRWLLANVDEADGVPFFPNWLAPEVPPRRNRVAWCYGDLGAATALLYAARCVGRTDWESQALPILRYAARNRGDEAGVLDAGICHGAAGNAHIFNRIYQATGEEVFKDAASYWYTRVFDFRQPGMGIAGFTPFRPKTEEPTTWIDNADLFNGVAGIGLSLLAATSEVAPAWDECLLVSLPPR